MKREFTQEQMEMIKEYVNNTPVIQIARKRSISREAVYQTLRRIENWEELRSKMSQDKRDISSKLAFRVREAVLGGVPIDEALEKWGLSITTFYRYCPDMAAGRRKESFAKTESIAKDWMSGMTYSKIAQKYNMFMSNIQRRLHLYYKKDWDKAKAKRKQLKSRK